MTEATQNNLIKAVLTILLIVVIMMVFFPKFAMLVRPMLGWFGILSTEPLDEKYVSIIKTEPTTSIMGYDPSDWRPGGQTLSCIDGKLTLKITLDRHINQNIVQNPKLLFDIYEANKCQVSDKEEEYQPVDIKLNEKNFDMSGRGTIITIAGLNCCYQTKSFIIRFNVNNEINNELYQDTLTPTSRTLNPSTDLIKFKTDPTRERPIIDFVP